MALTYLSRLKEMAEAHNAGPGVFKFWLTLGNVLSILTLVVTVAPIGFTIIQENAKLRDTVEHISSQTTANIASINNHLSSIDETARLAMIDDDRLKRVQDDIKDIRVHLDNIESRFHLRTPTLGKADQ